MKENLMKAIVKAVFAAAVSLTAFSSTYAENAQSAASAADSMSTGEIRKVDKSTGKVTIKHGELKNVGMSAMTMAFKVKDQSMLNGVKVGDKVNFVVEKTGSQMIVTQLEAQK
jgi:Cu(I)/Ag(I) efflux system periplasmic protein CusF